MGWFSTKSQSGKKSHGLKAMPGWAASSTPVAFYMRVFCAIDRIPALEHALEYLQSREILLEPEAGTSIANRQWSDATLRDAQGGAQVRLQCSRVNPDDPDDLAGMEIREFLNRIGRPGFSGAKRRVIKHLQTARAVIACKFPPGPRDQQTIRPHLELLRYFSSKCDGLMQVDGEGFYDKSNQLVLDTSKK
jgi:hypothetical protein